MQLKTMCKCGGRTVSFRAVIEAIGERYMGTLELNKEVYSFSSPTQRQAVDFVFEILGEKVNEVYAVV